MSFRVGQKVVCVDDSPCYLGLSTTLTKGTVYEVEQVFDRNGRIVLVVTGAPSWHPTRAYQSRRFRPVKTTSIEIFKAMLVNPKIPVDA